MVSREESVSKSIESSAPESPFTSIKCLPVSNVLKDTVLFGKFQTIIFDAYLDSSAVLQYALDRNTHMYLLSNTIDVQAFCFVAYEQNQGMPFVYVGLAGTDISGRAKGYFRQILTNIKNDVKEYQVNFTERVVVYARTAHPSAYKAFSSIFEIDPKIDGSYSAQGMDIALKLRTAHYDEVISDHPFVLRRSATYYYSDIERNYICQFQKILKDDIIRKLNIDERQGDRILLVMHLKER
jgi:hypothetical protein